MTLMKLAAQVCTLPQAKRLKELGVKQKSLFYWEGNLNSTAYFIRYIDYDNKKIWEDTFSAFTVAELGMMLPEEVEHEFNFSEKWVNYKNGKYICTLEFWKYEKNGNKYIDANGFGIAYRHNNNINISVPTGNCFSATNEAESRAEMLIYLLTTKIITLNY